MRGSELIEAVKRLRDGETVEVEGGIFAPYREEERTDYFDIYAIYSTRRGYFTGYIQFKDCGSRCRAVNHAYNMNTYRPPYSASSYYLPTSRIIGVGMEYKERWSERETPML